MSGLHPPSAAFLFSNFVMWGLDDHIPCSALGTLDIELRSSPGVKLDPRPLSLLLPLRIASAHWLRLGFHSRKFVIPNTPRHEQHSRAAVPASTALNRSFPDNINSAIATSFPALCLPSQELISSLPDRELKT